MGRSRTFNHSRIKNYYGNGASEYSTFSKGDQNTYSSDTRKSLDDRDKYNQGKGSEFNCSGSYDEEFPKYNKASYKRSKSYKNQENRSVLGKILGLVVTGVAVFVLVSYFTNGSFFSEANLTYQAVAEALSLKEQFVSPRPGISFSENTEQLSGLNNAPGALLPAQNDNNDSVSSATETPTSEAIPETEPEISVQSETEPESSPVAEPETSPVTEPETSPQVEPETQPQTSPVSQPETTVPESSTTVPVTTTQAETDPEPVTYTVRFDLNDTIVSCSAPSSIYGLSSGAKITAPAIPVDQNNNKTFSAWYKESDCTNLWDFDNDTVTANTTLYACWIQNFTVTFDTDGGSSVESQKIIPGGKVTKPSDPTKTKYIFTGWFKDTSKTTVWDFDNDTVSADTAIYAGWKKICTVTFDSDGGTEVTSVTAIEGELITKPSDPTKDKSVFTGWYKDADKTTVWDFDNDTVADDMTIYAKWVSHVLSKSKLDSLTKTFTGKLVFGNEAGNSGQYDSGSIVGEVNEYEGKVTVYEGAGSESGLVRYVLAEGSNQLGLPANCRDLLSSYSAESIVFADGQLDSANVTNAFCFFANNSTLKNVDLSGLDTSNMTNMNAFFYRDTSLATITWGTRFSTENATTMESFFSNCTSLTTIDLSGFNTSSVTNMLGMFYNCRGLTSLDLSCFDTSNVTNMYQMFFRCPALISLDLRSFNTSNVTNMCQMFVELNAMTSLDLNSFDTSNVTNMSMMFRNCSSLTEIIFGPSFNTGKVTTMAYMFDGLKNLVSLDVSHFDTSNVTDMLAMFYNCNSLKTLDVSGFNTAKVTNMCQLFYGCQSISSLDLSSFDTANVTNMAQMFMGCKALSSLNVSSFNTANVTSMSSMFRSCEVLQTLDLSSFSTGSVITMDWMFAYCFELLFLDLSGFNTENVTTMFVMFGECKKITSIDLTGLNTSKVTTMGSMFIRCLVLTELDLSSFDASCLTNSSQMFKDCGNLKTIFTSTAFDLSVKTDISSTIMFGNCFALTGGAGTKCTNSIIDNTRACIDQGSVKQGYFTAKDAPIGAGLKAASNALNTATPSDAVRPSTPSDALNAVY